MGALGTTPIQLIQPMGAMGTIPIQSTEGMVAPPFQPNLWKLWGPLQSEFNSHPTLGSYDDRSNPVSSMEAVGPLHTIQYMECRGAMQST